MKLKLMSFVFLAILIAISTQNLFTLPTIKSYIEKKAFEVSTTTIERISDFSLYALLERTYENNLSLDDAISKVEKSKIDGLIGVSIYQREKVDEKIAFKYISGFGEDVTKIVLDKDLIETLSSSINENVIYDSYTIATANESIDTYRFVRPIVYMYQDKKVLLGVTLLYYDKQAINSVIDNMFNWILTITTLILLIATLFVYFLGVRFTRPILEITEAATLISKGNLNIKLDIKTNDEIEDLAYHFNAMVSDLQERKKMQKFVSCSTMDMIQNNASKEIILGGEHRVLTVLFCDIRGFTALSEDKSPSEVISMVNFYLNLQAQIIKDNDGYIDKFIGDEIMASFKGEDSIKRAIKSAVEIQSQILKENVKRVQVNETVCEVGIGINKGEVIVGNVGSFEHMDFTAIGQSVNIASRLCSKAKAGEIIISKKSCENEKLDYKILEEDAYLVKGVNHPIETYTILGIQ